jgi:hypothetical protein
MNNYIRHISNFAFFLTADVLISTILVPPLAFAQTGKPVAELNDVWYLSYTVTVKGSDKIEPEPGSDEPTIYWKVDRTYSGTITLANSKLFNEGSENTTANSKVKRFIQFTSDSRKVNIKINDYIIKITEDEICNENIKILDKTTYEADITGETNNLFDTFLTIDNQTRTHNVSIPVLLLKPVGGKIDSVISKRTLETIKTTASGVTTAEVKNLEQKNISVFNFLIPKILGLIENKVINHRDYEPLKVVSGGYEYISTQLTVTEKLLPNIYTGDKVKIQVYYRFTK